THTSSPEIYTLSLHDALPIYNGVKAVTGMTVGPVNVEFPGVAKSTWNLNRLRLLLPKNTRKLGDPAGGAVAPSRSEGSNPPTVEDRKSTRLNSSHLVISYAVF